MKNKNLNNGFKAGVDFFLNDKSTFGVLVNGNVSNGVMNNTGTTNINYAPTNNLERILVANNSTDQNQMNTNFNLNFRNVQKDGREFSLDADYGLFRIRRNQLQPNIYYDPTYNKLSEFAYRFITPTNIDIFSLKGDYEQNYLKGKLGYGFKVSKVMTDNNFGRYNVVANNDILDLDRSNLFKYAENINAGYVNYNRAFKGFLVQAGVRLENTNLEGDSYPLTTSGNADKNSSQSFKRHYTDAFPSAAITFNKNPKNPIINIKTAV